ncbi:MAG: long-chain fatty acid--CoA ligase [Candidatus Omnitrophica bacterium]|nr:long-chain fatty acid--CoA ligase [Candidatus Omnitrophota bacterium]
MTFHKVQSIPALFAQTAREFSDKTALRVRRADSLIDISWGNFLEVVCYLAMGLSEIGLKAHDKVCMIAENCAEWLYFDLAILSNKAVVVPLYTNCSDHDLNYILKHSEAKILVVSDDRYLERFLKLPAGTTKIEKVVVVNEIGEHGFQNVVSYNYLIERGRKQGVQSRYPFYEKVQDIKSDDIATIIYTSGTTGDPKGVMLTHENFIANCEGCADAIHVTREDVSLSFLPLSHIFERLAGYYFFLFSGATMGFAESMYTVMRDMQDIKPTIMCAVPRFFERIYHGILDTIEKQSFIRRAIFTWGLRIGRSLHTFKRRGRKVFFGTQFMYGIFNKILFVKLRESLGGNFRFFISGGAALSKDIAYFFEIIGITILEGYGLTETSPVVSVNRERNNKIGTVGLPLSNLEVKIADGGEIAVKGRSVMRGYFKDDQSTSETIREGWLYTGDVGRLDQNGFLKIIDRKKDIIVISGGKNIAPQMLENALVSDPMFSQVIVFGDNQKYLVALIVPHREHVEFYAKQHKIDCASYEALLEHKEIHAHAKRHVARALRDFAQYEKIKKFKLLKDEFTLEDGELTPTYKVRRKIILNKYKQLIASLYE